MLEQIAKNPGGKGSTGFVGYAGQPMVKRPGEAQWIPLAPQTTAYYQSVVQPKCPGGGSNENLSRVFPD
jgi:hypothetical protein